VWLIAAGELCTSPSHSLTLAHSAGFYLPLMIVLWLLILRGASIEFRNHIKSAVWIRCGIFCSVLQLLLAVFFGRRSATWCAVVPLDSSGLFLRNRCWTNFRLGDETGILDWYTMLVRSIGPARADDARWTVGTDEDQRRSPLRVREN